MTTPRISVVMLTFNRPQFISRAIQSIVDQDLPDWELLVVHDGPNEEIPVIMRDWEQRNPRVRYFRRAVPGNIAEATNFALRAARGEYIAILDDDDYWAVPDKLRRQVEFLDTHRDHVACGGGVIVVDQDGREQMRYLKPEHDADIRRRALIANPMAHSTMLYRRQTVLDLGGYDESLPGYQDWDLWLKLGKVGRLHNFPEHLLCYRVWHGSGSFLVARRNTESALRITRRHRHDYAGFAIGYSLARLHDFYASLPIGVQRMSYSFLSRLKKAVFGARARS